jgi:hypothetical protein
LEKAAEIYSLSVYLNLLLSKFSIVMQKTAIHELKTLLELHFGEIAKNLSPSNLDLLKVYVQYGVFFYSLLPIIRLAIDHSY